jgi:hypothetical protein
VQVFLRRGAAPFVYIGSAVADALSPATRVHSNNALQGGDLLVANQMLCNAVSEFDRPTLVARPPAFGSRPFYVIGHNPTPLPS